VSATVRAAVAADAAGIAALYAELGYSLSPGDVAGRMAGPAAGGRSAVLVAERHGSVVGLLTLHMVPVLHEPGDWCRITSLVVHPAARRSGVGRALVAQAESRARAAGCARIEVTSAVHRDGAHDFYRGEGYGRVSEHFLKRLREPAA
jgi:ribosomal protein S18 acetylase RimI-like enzyme